MKKLLVVIGVVSLLLGFSFLAPAVIIDPSMQFIVGNETYKVNATMVFDQIIISSSYIVFNDTGFYVFSPNSILITLVYINDDVIGAANGEKIVDFYAATTAGTVWFNLSGFPVGNEYVIKRNGVTVSTRVANASGFISFSNAAWSTQRFQIFQQAQAPGDSIPPQISGVTRTTSNPLDTDPTYGWVNVSCTVTDNVAVSQVILRIHTPGGSWNNVSMQAGTAGKYYYRSTTAFSSAGNYSYSIWAKDTSNNAVTSSTVLFSMPPRWDINSDGVVTILDLVLISNHYGEIGASGWIREDVDNNGRVQILDMSLVSVHFGELWYPVFIVAEANGSTVISITPVSQTISPGDSVTVTVDCVPQRPVKAFELKLSFNPSVLQATSVSEGDLFDGYTTFFNPGIINNVAGTIVNIYDLIVGPGNVTSPGSFVTINFTALSSSGTSTLSLYDVRVTNETEYIEISVSSASVTVAGGSSPPPSGPPENPPPSSQNQPPSTPLEPSGPVFIEVGTSYEYTDSAVDPDGDSVRLRFDWGDGSLSNWTGFMVSNTSVAASHAWGNASTYAVRVIAQDTNGSNSSWSDPLTVEVSQAGLEGSPPVGEFNVPQNASANQTIIFDASGSYDPDGMIVSYLWDFGDGVTGAGENPTHTYRFPGEYTVTLTVTDNAGMTFRISQVVSIAAGSVVPTEDGADFLQSNSSAIILITAAVTFLILLFFFRNKIQELFLQKRIETSHRRLAQFDRSTADIDEIVDSLFLEMKQKTKNPNKAYILDAYSDLIIGNVEKNPAFHVPDVSIVDVERIVDGLIQSKIVAKLEKS